MTTPVLSLCVPTFNRCSLLSQSLGAILSQIGPGMTEAVEVVVLDNASPDGTPRVVAEAQAAFPHVPVRYVRRPENIGCDANFTEAPKSAKGEFVYLLSDDDILLPGAVTRLLELIQAHPEFDAFSLNVRQFWDDPYDENTPWTYRLEEDRILRSRDEVLSLIKQHIVFISCIAFRRETVLGRDYTQGRGTNMGQSYMFLDALAPGKGVYVTREPYLAMRADSAQGYDFYRVWVTNFSRLMGYARSIGYSPQVIRAILRAHLTFVRHFTVIFKTQGHYDQLRPNFPDAVLRLLRTYRLSPFMILRILPVILTPRPVFRPVQSLYRWLNRTVKSLLGWPRAGGPALSESRP